MRGPFGQTRTCLWALSALLLLPGCAITLNLPANRFESPEAQGGQSLYFEGGVQGANQLVIVPLTTADPPRVDSPSFRRSSSSALLGAGIGLFSRLDLGVRIVAHAPTLLKVKYQILGPGRLKSEPRTFSLAVSGGIGTSRKSQQDHDGFTSVDANSESQFLTYDGSLIGGYRSSRSMLLYGSVFSTTTEVDGSITVLPSSSVSSFRGDARQRGASLGLELKTGSLGLMMEAGYGAATYHSIEEDGMFFGILVRFYSSRIR